MRTIVGIFFIALLAFSISGQTTSFTYQGHLTNGAAAANGTYEMQFGMYDAVAGGTQIGTTRTNSSVSVVNGIFTVNLDFGPGAFPGADRFMQIGVRTGGSPNPFTLLAPRQPMSSAPYAVRALNSAAANDAANLGGMPASEYVVTNDPRLIDARIPTPGSPDYIQNTTTQQTFSNFNIAGIGKSTIFDAASQYNIGGNRVLSIAGANNVFVGANAGGNNSSGFGNSFIGTSAGSFNTTGSANSFFGDGAGYGNSAGSNNAFFGRTAGGSNAAGSRNSFFGDSAGLSNTGNDNSFFGKSAGEANTTGVDNSFFGTNAGQGNTTGYANSFFGFYAGSMNTTGDGNSFFGRNAGFSNTTGRFNAFIGQSAGHSNTSGSYNSFVGQGAGLSNTTGVNNSFFGEVAGASNTTGNYNSFIGFQAGNSNTIGGANVFVGHAAGYASTTGGSNSFLGANAGVNNSTGFSNSFIGTLAGSTNTTGTKNTLVGYNADLGAGNLTNATAAGYNALVSCSNCMVLGGVNGINGATADTNVGIGTTTPTSKLHIADNDTGGTTIVLENLSAGSRRVTLSNYGFNGAGNYWPGLSSSNSSSLLGNNLFVLRSTTGLAFSGSSTAEHMRVTTTGNVGIGTTSPAALLDVNGSVRVASLVSGGSTSLCWNAGFLSSCSSSLRYKTNIGNFHLGLEVINRLKPITFDWKDDAMHDLGLGAEDVEKIEPLLVTYNEQGQVEGVKYDRIGVVLVNAVKEQQAQIGALQTQIKDQQKQIEVFKAVVCAANPTTAVCQKD